MVHMLLLVLGGGLGLSFLYALVSMQSPLDADKTSLAESLRLF